MVLMYLALLLLRIGGVVVVRSSVGLLMLLMLHNCVDNWGRMGYNAWVKWGIDS